MAWSKYSMPTWTISSIGQCLIMIPRMVWGLIAVGSLATFLDFYALADVGFGDTYYAATVKSMSMNWHAFFFAAFDAGGFVSIDKPPLGLWIQAITVKVFGFSSFSLMAPQAIAGVLAVMLLYYLIYQSFGFLAAILSGLFLDISPINVVTNRDNTLDSMLVLMALLCVWLFQKMIASGEAQWLIGCALMLGLGFNIKGFEAFLVLPALIGAWICVSVRQRWAVLCASILLLIGVSLAWAVVVDAIPAANRPFVGSTRTNSEIELAFVYNGIDRLAGIFSIANDPHTNNVAARVIANHEHLGGEDGPPGPLRLFSRQLGGQGGWFLSLGFFGCVMVAGQLRRRNGQTFSQWRARLREQWLSVFLWLWFVTSLLFFSVVGYFHAFYLALFSPAICTLAGIGIANAWHVRERDGWRTWLLPCALIASFVFQIYILTYYRDWLHILIWPLTLALLCSLGALLLTRPLQRETPMRLLRYSGLILGLAVLCSTPLIWDDLSLLPATHPRLIAGPPLPNAFYGSHGNPTYDPMLVAYLKRNQGHDRYLAAALNTDAAAPLILMTGEPVMALRGYTGIDPVIGVDGLTRLIAQQQVRYVLLFTPYSVPLSPAQLAALPPAVQQAVKDPLHDPASQSHGDLLIQWVTRSCSEIAPTAIDPHLSPAIPGESTLHVFDCYPEAAS